MKLILITLVAGAVLATSACSKSEDDLFLIEMADWYGEYMEVMRHDSNYENEVWVNRVKNSMPKPPNGFKYQTEYKDFRWAMDLMVNAQTRLAEYIPVESLRVWQKYGDPVPAACMNINHQLFSSEFRKLCEEQGLANANWQRVRWEVWERDIFKINNGDKYGVLD